MSQRREIRSAYIEWAKLRAGAAYNLAASDLLHFPMRELKVYTEELEITGPGGYGYEPLQQRLAARAGAGAGPRVVPGCLRARPPDRA